MSAATARTLPQIGYQHAEETAALRNIRSVLVAAPHVNLRHLQRLDERLAAHLDGLAVAGTYGWELCEQALERPGVGEVFTATVRALEDKNLEHLYALFVLAVAVPESQPGLISAFGWVSAHELQGTIKTLLDSSDTLRRRVGLAACGMHGVDPGKSLDECITHTDASTRARALRVAGELGRRDLLAACLEKYPDPASQFEAARSAVLLGDRGQGLASLKKLGLTPDHAYRERALQLVLKALDLKSARALLDHLKADAKNLRALIQGSGIAGDPAYLPWLITHMGDAKTARVAGEAFSLITGLDLAELDLERSAPTDIDAGPNDDPEDANVAMDADENLPWPDAEKLQAWWNANGRHFETGTRYFLGATLSVAQCRHVLCDGFQRQRAAAAQHLCLLIPGTPLFNTHAPARRQQRWLGNMQ